MLHTGPALRRSCFPPFSPASGAGAQRDGDLDVLAVAPHGQLDGVADLVLVQAAEQPRYAVHRLAVHGGDDVPGADAAVGGGPPAAPARGLRRGSAAGPEYHHPLPSPPPRVDLIQLL